MILLGRAQNRCVFVCLASLLVAGIARADDPQIRAERLRAHVQTLAGEAYRGRRVASEDERSAARYIAEQLDKAGVAAPPAGRFQEFTVELSDNAQPLSSLNVLGWIQGSHATLAEDIVVVGAHLDHLGVIDGTIYPGADDNASGVAVLLEIGAALQQQAPLPGRSVLVVFFGGEEYGLLGSRAFVGEPPVAMDHIVTMINIDMIGRPLQDQATLRPLLALVGIDPSASMAAVGAHQHPFFAKTVEEACLGQQLQAIGVSHTAVLAPALQQLSRNRSDHAPFEAKGIPTLFFSSGESDDYHRPGDVPEKLDYPLMERRAKAIYHTAFALATAAPGDIPVNTAAAGSNPTAR